MLSILVVLATLVCHVQSQATTSALNTSNMAQIRFVNCLEQHLLIEVITETFTLPYLYNGNVSDYNYVVNGMMSISVVDGESDKLLIDTSIGVWDNRLYTVAVFLDSSNTVQLQQFLDSFEMNQIYTKNNAVMRFINLAPGTTAMLHDQKGNDQFGQIGYLTQSVWMEISPSAKTKYTATLQGHPGNLTTEYSGFALYEPLWRILYFYSVNILAITLRPTDLWWPNMIDPTMTLM